VAGDTATIDVAFLREQWASHIPISQICTNFTITRDQVTRLKFVYDLPPRHDRSLRYKPPRDPGPDDAEELASRESLSLAPQIAARVTCVQAMWTEQTRLDRTMPTAPGAGMLRWINAKEIVQRFARSDELQGDG
jgi:hypothetical protein